MAIVKANYLHKLISPQSAKGHWYERRGRVWWLSWELSLASINIISGDYKHSMDLFISSGMNLCYTPIFLLDWCCRSFAIIHLQLHSVAEKLKTPGMHRVNVWNCIHKMWCRVSPQSSLDTVSALLRWMLRMYLDVEIWKLCAMTASAAVAPGRAGGSQPQIRAGNRKHCARCEDD